MAKFSVSSDSENWRTYSLRVPVRSYFWEAVRGERIFSNNPRPVPLVASEVGAIRGIQSFYTREGYELVVHKADSYEWSEFEDQLHAAIDNHDNTAEWPLPKEEDFSEETVNVLDDSEYDPYDTGNQGS